LTPRLFALQPGDRLFVESRAAGKYTLGDVAPDNNIFFFATGTGEAPHNAMIAELLSRGHRGKIVSIVSVRQLRDAAYRAGHEQLMRRYIGYRYFVLVTREQQSNALLMSGMDRPCHLQDLVASGELERQSGVLLDPSTAHVFLCGNPNMIGAVHGTGLAPPTAKPGSMLEILFERGFQCIGGSQRGIVHFERYW
jgi:ferredoxin--NADP+ reductase